jgi:hypothetical protein
MSQATSVLEDQKHSVKHLWGASLKKYLYSLEKDYTGPGVGHGEKWRSQEEMPAPTVLMGTHHFWNMTQKFPLLLHLATLLARMISETQY